LKIIFIIPVFLVLISFGIQESFADDVVCGIDLNRNKDPNVLTFLGTAQSSELIAYDEPFYDWEFTEITHYGLHNFQIDEILYGDEEKSSVTMTGNAYQVNKLKIGSQYLILAEKSEKGYFLDGCGGILQHIDSKHAKNSINSMVFKDFEQYSKNQTIVEFFDVTFTKDSSIPLFEITLIGKLNNMINYDKIFVEHSYHRENDRIITEYPEILIDNDTFSFTQKLDEEYLRNNHDVRIVLKEQNNFISETIFFDSDYFEESIEIFSIDFGRMVPPPKIQLENGILSEDITCKDGLELIFKSTNGSPACVKPKTAEKLIERGWARV